MKRNSSELVSNNLADPPQKAARKQDHKARNDEWNNLAYGKSMTVSAQDKRENGALYNYPKPSTVANLRNVLQQQEQEYMEELKKDITHKHELNQIMHEEMSRNPDMVPEGRTISNYMTRLPYAPDDTLRYRAVDRWYNTGRRDLASHIAHNKPQLQAAEKRLVGLQKEEADIQLKDRLGEDLMRLIGDYLE